jgi:hypothetical protein
MVRRYLRGKLLRYEREARLSKFDPCKRYLADNCVADNDRFVAGTRDLCWILAIVLRMVLGKRRDFLLPLFATATLSLILIVTLEILFFRPRR